MITLLLSLVLIISNIYAMEVESPEHEQKKRFIVDFSTNDCPTLSVWLFGRDSQEIFDEIDDDGGFTKYPRGTYLPRINVQKGRHFRISIDLSKKEVKFPLEMMITEYSGRYADNNGFNDSNPRHRLFLEESFHGKTIILDYNKCVATIDNVNICKRTDEQN